MEKHTPGPWRVDPVWGLIVGPKGEQQEICAVHANEYVPTKEAKANAVLIAHSPKLLEAVRRVARTDPESMNSLQEFIQWAQAMCQEEFEKATSP